MEALNITDDAAKTSDTFKFNVVEPPRVPSEPSSPHRPLLNSVVLAVALGGGAGLAWLLAVLPRFATLPRRLLAETLRRMLSPQVHDVISATQAQLDRHAPDSADAVRGLPPLARFSEPMREQSTQLKRLLFAALYRHPQVTRTTERAREVVQALFAAYTSTPGEMPEEQAVAHARRGFRVVAAYIAGMTDRFASREYQRLTGRPAFAEG